MTEEAVVNHWKSQSVRDGSRKSFAGTITGGYRKCNAMIEISLTFTSSHVNM
jgi:hypothetical protein